MTYKALSTDSLCFTVSRQETLIGKLHYNNWFSHKAAIEIPGNPFLQIAPKDFWGTSIELKSPTSVLLSFKINWSGNIILQTFFDNVEADFVFKQKGVIPDAFTLMDRENRVLVVVTPDFKWAKMNYAYTLETAAIFDQYSHQEIILLTLIHCANYYITTMTAALTTTIF